MNGEFGNAIGACWLGALGKWHANRLFALSLRVSTNAHNRANADFGRCIARSTKAAIAINSRSGLSLAICTGVLTGVPRLRAALAASYRIAYRERPLAVIASTASRLRRHEEISAVLPRLGGCGGDPGSVLARCTDRIGRRGPGATWRKFRELRGRATQAWTSFAVCRPRN